MDVVAGAREEIACVSRRALQRNLIRMIFECVSSTCDKYGVYKDFQAPLKLVFQFKNFSRSCMRAIWRGCAHNLKSEARRRWKALALETIIMHHRSTADSKFRLILASKPVCPSICLSWVHFIILAQFNAQLQQ
jgi:hypothetical protein